MPDREGLLGKRVGGEGVERRWREGTLWRG
jgi:hypothetical protein